VWHVYERPILPALPRPSRGEIFAPGHEAIVQVSRRHAFSAPVQVLRKRTEIASAPTAASARARRRAPPRRRRRTVARKGAVGNQK